MPTEQTLGNHLINELMPVGYKFDGPISKKILNTTMTRMARTDPQTYAQIVGNVKRLGDHLATTEGLSVGLDDIDPSTPARDKLMRETSIKFNKAKNDTERRAILEHAHPQFKDLSMVHPGSMTMQVASGARGNPVAYMKIVSSPVYARSGRGQVEPWLLKNSYSQGMTPADNWVVGNEAILDTIKSSTSVSEPGELSKILVSNMSNILVTEQDCGTKNGILMDAKNPNSIDRYLARAVGSFPANTLITPTNQPSIARAAGAMQVTLRSPMTCEAGDGVCQRCQGLNERGHHHDIGTNVGVRSAQAMSEPLTQLTLGAKHGVKSAKDDRLQLQGVAGFRQAIESPNLFLHKATLASVDGKIESITKAPQGGHFVTVAGKEHYVTPNLSVKMKVGDIAERGDALSSGIPKPDEIVKYKGLGAGRVYMVNTLHDLYASQGINLDQRHFELLALGELNQVRILNDHGSNFIRGDIVNYNNLKSVLSKDVKQVPLSAAEGETLGKEYFHFSVGARILPSTVQFLKSHGIKEVFIAPRAPEVEFVMKPATRAPLFNPDWMARLSHRNLKVTLQQAAHFGEVSDIHGSHPVPAYVLGTEFGQGEKGKY
jgi:DNA-directed RNA polymerase subunit beta'